MTPPVAEVGFVEASWILVVKSIVIFAAVFAIAPVIAILPAFLAFAVIPFGMPVTLWGRTVPLQLAWAVRVIPILMCPPSSSSSAAYDYLLLIKS